MKHYALAVDIGGTFTDVVLRASDGQVWVDKVLTSYDDLLDGFMRGVDEVLARAGVMPAQVDDIVAHATTIVTNALIARSGPRIALLTTAGFRDVLYIRDEHRYDMYDPQIEYHQPLVPSELTFGINERTRGDGSITREPDPAEVGALAQTLKVQGVISVALCFLNSYRNPANERVVGALLKEALPELYVSLSSEVAPQIREYPRTSTTVINAYAEPVAQPYLQRMSDLLVRRGFPHAPMVMLSNGGVVSAGVAGHFPVRMIESGPAAGALAASYYAEALKTDRLLSFDMGGTTAKACLIEHHVPHVAGMFEVDRKYRFQAGSGMPVTIPSIDMIEIGAGGGSIAACDDLKLLKVGPRSAGSTPGPVCYGRGGTDVCVTDADLALGLLDADHFLGGDMKLDARATQNRLAVLANALGLTAADTAAGIYRLVGETMALAARAHAADRGVDFRGIPMLAFGGAGPVHACYVAELLGSSKVIFPPQASVLSAFGMLVTPVRYDLARSALGHLAAMDWDATGRIFDELIAAGRRALIEAGCRPEQIRYDFSGDLRYLGQQDEVTVEVAQDLCERRDLAALREAFEHSYETQYGLRLAENEVEVVCWRLSCRGPEVRRDVAAQLAAHAAGPSGQREVRIGGTQHKSQRYALYRRLALASGQQIEGPALIEERETTTVILPGWKARVHASGCVIAERG